MASIGKKHASCGNSAHISAALKTIARNDHDVPKVSTLIGLAIKLPRSALLAVIPQKAQKDSKRHQKDLASNQSCAS
jgi:hypothetical protein